LKRFILILIFIILMDMSVFAKEEIDVLSKSAVLMEYETGRVLYNKNINEPLPMASTTKIMTAIIALESNKIDDIAVVSKNAASAPEVKMGLHQGEEHIIKYLLYPLMLVSANDAAVVIAEHIGGSVEGFAELMNKKAKEIGALDTVFVTPNGLDKGNHHSTAYDMALISRYALENSEFREIINTPSKTITSKDKSKRTYTFNNKNRLLKEYSGALGIKTGFTVKAGNCFAGAAQRNGLTLISVVLNSGWNNSGKERKWIDTKNILNYGFENYSMEKIAEKYQDCGYIDVLFSKEKRARAVIKEEGYACITKEEKEGLKYVYEFDENIQAPLNINDKVGKMKVYTSTGEIIFETDIVSAENIKRHDFNTCLKKVLKIWAH